MPASVSRAIIHAGVGAEGSTPRDSAHHEFGRTHPATDRRGVLHRDGEAVTGFDFVRRPQTRVVESGAGGVRVLAGDAADRQRIAPVGGHVDLDRDVVQAEELDRVGADGSVDAERGKAEDPVVLLTEAEVAR